MSYTHAYLYTPQLAAQKNNIYLSTRGRSARESAFFFADSSSPFARARGTAQSADRSRSSHSFRPLLVATPYFFSRAQTLPRPGSALGVGPRDARERASRETESARHPRAQRERERESGVCTLYTLPLQSPRVCLAVPVRAPPPTWKTPDLRVRPTGSASGGPEEPRYGQLAGSRSFRIYTLSLLLFSSVMSVSLITSYS